MAYAPQEISDELLADTRKAWELFIGTDEFMSEYGALFDWLETHRDYQQGNGTSAAYALVQEGHKIAAAFIEIVSSTNKGGLTKLLKVFITPQFWDVADHQTEVVHLFVAAIMGSIKISANKNSRVIKIYGRSASLLSLLHTIHADMIRRLDPEGGVTVAMQGRWLEISCK